MFTFCKASWAKWKKKQKENHATKVTEIPKTKRRKYEMNENYQIRLHLNRLHYPLINYLVMQVYPSLAKTVTKLHSSVSTFVPKIKGCQILIRYDFLGGTISFGWKLLSWFQQVSYSDLLNKWAKKINGKVFYPACN